MAFLDIDGCNIAYQLHGGEALPLVVLGHPLGMSQAVWADVSPALLARYRVLSWDLPGHGASAAWPQERGPITPAELAQQLLRLVDAAGVERFHYVGTSIGGSIGQQLLADSPARLLSATLTNTGAIIGSSDGWRDRARRVRSEGLASMAGAIVARWFGAAALAEQPALAGGWQTQLARTDAESYALLCEMLGRADYHGQLQHTGVRVQLVGGGEDVAAPAQLMASLARECADAPLEIVAGVGHVPAVECPQLLAARVLRHCAGDIAVDSEQGASYSAGLATRKQVLGEAHVERASAAATSLDAPFQRLITRLAWGELWGNHDLSRHERSMITIAVLAALGRDGELGLHLRTARRIGLSEAQLRQALMHVAIYAGVPAANHAFAMARDAGWGEAQSTDTH